MATTCVLNGAKKIQGTDSQVRLIVDATIGGVHHQGVFLLADVLKQPTAAAQQKYMLQQMLALDTASSGFTTVPSELSGTIGSISI